MLIQLYQKPLLMWIKETYQLNVCLYIWQEWSDTVKKMKGQGSLGKKIFTNHLPHKNVYPELVKTEQ